MPGLLGQDLLRLALERSKTADEAVTVVGDLLTKYGQGGLCAEPGKGNYTILIYDHDTIQFLTPIFCCCLGYDELTYENSFLIADKKEAFVFETVGKQWAAQRVTGGGRNISNCLTITSQIDRESDGLRQLALDNGWDGKKEFNFTEIFQSKSGQDTARLEHGRKYLAQFDDSKKFDIFAMMAILRDEPSSICRGIECNYPSQGDYQIDCHNIDANNNVISILKGAQISVLPKNENKRQVHLFTGTPNTNLSVFKPFVFSKGLERLTKQISEPVAAGSQVHLLYAKHQAAYEQLKLNENDLNTTLRSLERAAVEELMSETKEPVEQLELSSLFDDSVDAELRFYK